MLTPQFSTSDKSRARLAADLDLSTPHRPLPASPLFATLASVIEAVGAVAVAENILSGFDSGPVDGL